LLKLVPIAEAEADADADADADAETVAEWKIPG
jgi:hypothetical protein